MRRLAQAGRALTARAREMAAVLAAWERSGMSQAAFARQRGIPAGTLAWWRREFRRRGVTPQPQPLPFVEVLASPATAASPAWAFEVVLGPAVSVRVPAAFDAAALRQLLTVLGPRC